MLSGSDDKSIRLWDAVSGALLRTFKGHSGGVTSVVFSPDGARVLSGSYDGTVKLWDAGTGALLRTFEGHSSWVTSVAFSPDGVRVLSGSWDKTLRLRDAATGALLRTFEHSDRVTSVAFSADAARVLSGGLDKTVRLWDAASGTLLRTFEGRSSIVYSLAFSPDGTRVLSGSEDRSVRLWDAATGALLRTFDRHSGSVRSVAFSPDGRRIVSGSTDTTVRVWDTAAGAQLAILIAGRDGQRLVMTPAGFFAASGNGTEMLAVVRGLEAYSVMQFYDHLHRPDLVEELLKGDPEGKYKDASRRLNLEAIIDSGPAPRIELLPARTEKRGDRIKLAARLVDEGGGIGPKVIWRVNGKTLGATAPPGSLGSLDYVIMEQTFTVDPSKRNEIEIVAYNGKGLLASQPLRFGVDAWGVTEKERPRMFVLAVGVDKYPRSDWQLRYAAKDAGAFAEALQLVGGPLFSQVQVRTLVDADVTEPKIAAEFERLAGIVKARDVFVLFLGGHGRSIAGEGWFYIPQDFDLDKGHRLEKEAIGPGKLRDWLAKVHAEKSLVVLDACESGAFEAFRGGDRERETVMAQLEYATGRNYITAAPAGKAAYEGYKGHGVLTYAILEALHRPKGAAADNTSVSVLDVARHVSREVPIITYRTFAIRQQPRLTQSGDDFPLGIRTAVLKDLPPPISTQLTHYTRRALQVFKESGGKGGVVAKLQADTPVTVIATQRGWAHIARGSEALGYVQERGLRKFAQ